MSTTGLDAIRITQKQAKIISALLRLPSNVPTETMTRLTLQDPNFCDRMMGILFPRRRPPSITPPVIHQCVRQLGVERISRLFICNSIFNAFANINLPGYRLEIFWLDCLRRGFAAQYLAESIEYPDSYEAFCAGFISEIGSVLLAARFPHISKNLFTLRNRLSETRSNTERIVTGNTHAEEIKRTGFSRLLTPRTLQAISMCDEAYPDPDRQSQLTCILHVADHIGDIGQSYPKKAAIDAVNDALKLLNNNEIDVESIFTIAETQANSLAQDLGLDVPAAIDFQSLLNMPMPKIDDNGFDSAYPLSAERPLEDRNVFMSRVKNHIQNREPETAISLLLINIDHFSKINTTYGYPLGDNLLRRLSQQIAKTMRTADFVAHLGGDEFGLLLPKTQAVGARVAAERIRAMVKVGTLTIGSLRISATVSIGGITIDDKRPYSETDPMWADLAKAMKKSKNAGRNRTSWVAQTD